MLLGCAHVFNMFLICCCFLKLSLGIVIGVVIGIVILLLLYRLLVVGKILISENLGEAILPTPSNDSPDRDDSRKKKTTS